MMFVNREREREELLELSKRGRPTMALLYGRRRVGKTYLLTHLWPEETCFYFTASAVSAEQNRRRLVDEFSEWIGVAHHAADYPTWRTVFRLLFSLDRDEPVVVVLDEFQYFGENQAALDVVTSELNAIWEGRNGPSGSFLLVLSGSAVGVMDALDSGSAPLHGRLAWRGKLEPFDYLDAATMAPFDSLRERASAYGVFGGMPRYLSPVDTERTFAENVARLMLSPRGEVRGQVETAILQEQGLRDIPHYLGILRAIGAGRTELNEIADRVGLEKHTVVRHKVERLVELGYVAQTRNYDAGRTVAWRYRISDPAFRFYYEFVTRHESALEKNAASDVWERYIEPNFDAYMGHLFEVIVEQAYTRRRELDELPMVAEWGRWEGTDRDGESLEIDIVSRRADGSMLTGSIKWNRSPVGIGVHRTHMRDLDRLASSGRRWAHEARESGSHLLYVAAGGFEDNFLERASEENLPVTLWTLDDLY